MHSMGVKFSRDELQQKVIGVIKEHVPSTSTDNIHEGSHINDDLGMDSIDSVELVMALEGAFGIKIPDEDAHKITTVKSVVDYIMVQLEKDSRS